MNEKLTKIREILSKVKDLTERLRKLFPNEEKRPYCAGVVLAAGNSVRMGENKIEMCSGSMPVFIRTLKVFENAETIDETVLVTREDRIEALAEEIKKYGLKKVKCVISGGNTRAESSLAGALAVSRQTEVIAIHDCARPFVTEKVINDVVTAAARYNAAAPAIPCVDTLKIRDGDFSKGTADRESLCRIQTPQAFRADLIKGALTCAIKKGLPVTDDTSVAEYMGFRTRLVDGDPDNIKLTTKKDLVFARAILEARGEVL